MRKGRPHHVGSICCSGSVSYTHLRIHRYTAYLYLQLYYKPPAVKLSIRLPFLQKFNIFFFYRLALLSPAALPFVPLVLVARRGVLNIKILQNLRPPKNKTLTCYSKGYHQLGFLLFKLLAPYKENHQLSRLIFTLALLSGKYHLTVIITRYSAL